MRLRIKKLLCLLLFCLGFTAPLHASLLSETSIPNNTGVNIHFLDSNIEQQVALLKQAHFGWVRKDLNWEGIEQQKGVYNFSRYDRLIDALNHVGIRVLLILDYSNPLYDSNFSPYTRSGRQAFAKFAEAAAKHYAKKNVAWEIYNEPNWGFWKPMPHLENYLALARLVTQTLRRAVPHQAIIAPALAGPTAEADKIDAQYIYLKWVLQDASAKKWDGISIHPYRGNRAPEDVFNEMPHLNHLMTVNKIQSPLIFTEWGYHTSEKGIDEDTEAAFAVRSFLIANSLRMPFSIWYNWQEQGDDTSDSEQKYGLIRHGTVDAGDDVILKPAFLAVREMNEQLSGYRFDKVIMAKNGLYCMSFKKGAERAYALWTTTKTPTPYGLTLPTGQWQTKYILGDSNTITVTQPTPAALQLQIMPLIVKPIHEPN